MAKRTIIIGLDGVPFILLQDFAYSGVMPNTKKVLREGNFRKMRSSIPEVSSVAWASIITGRNPAEHGIFGFTDLAPGAYRLIFPNFNNLRCAAFWHKNRGKKHVILNVPLTYPAKELNGVLVSGFVALELGRAVYPGSLVSRLKEMDYRIDVDSDKAHHSFELFIKDLNKTNEARISAYRYLWDTDWDTFMFVFTGTDRLMHFLWNAYEDPEHDFHRHFLCYFARIDEVIGEIASRMREGDSLIMLSDHGFEKLDKEVYVNHILKKEGFLKLTDEKEVNFNGMDHQTKAFALDPARIYINMKNKYPRGSVSDDEKEDVIEDLVQLFESFEIDNKKIIKHVYRREEIYHGPHISLAPDLVLISAKGFNLKSAMNSADTCSKGIFTGKHTYDDAFLFINRKSKDEIVPKDPTVCDLLDIMNRMNGET